MIKSEKAQQYETTHPGIRLTGNILERWAEDGGGGNRANRDKPPCPDRNPTGSAPRIPPVRQGPYAAAALPILW
jgi:hypothetical protein